MTTAVETLERTDVERPMQGIRFSRNPGNGFAVLEVHYTADPAKRDPEWKARMSKGMTRRQWDQEYEMNWQLKAGQPIFAEFERQVHAATSLQLRPDAELLRGWDFGYHRPACVFAQFNQADQLCILGAVIGKDVHILHFARQALKWFPDAKTVRDFCDPAGNQRSDKSERTSIEMLQSLGVYPEWHRTGIKSGVDLIRHLLFKRPDLRPGLLVDGGCEALLDGFEGGYSYPEARPGQIASELPDKDGYYDHLFDALRYLVVGVVSVPMPEEPVGARRPGRFADYHEIKHIDPDGWMKIGGDEDGD